MNLHHALQKCLEDWNRISNLEFALLTPKKGIVASSSSKKLPSDKVLQDFIDSTALIQGNAGKHFYKIMEEDELIYLLLVWGKTDSCQTIGELAVCQIQSLRNAYREKSDKNTFMQNLLLGSYSSIDAHNRAKKLHIATEAKRAIILVETRQHKDENALATIRNLFSARSRDFITTLNNEGIVIIKEMNSTDSYKTLEETALMLVDMLNTEAMTSAWVAYSNISDQLDTLPDAYKEAKTAMEVGKIFYAQRNTFGYNQLGIGRLIYQLPDSICEMFIDEILKEEQLDSLDEETLITIRTFFENNLNLSETSRQLYVHRNTLVYRFEKLEKKFGLDIRTFDDALTFKIAMMVTDYLKYNAGKNSLPPTY